MDWSGFELLYLALYWALWCALHSALAEPALTRPLERLCGAFYRIFYNVFSILSLLPLLFFTRQVRGELIFVWHGWEQVVQGVLLVAAGVLFVLGGRRYDLKIFLGLAASGQGLAAKVGLDTSGVLNWVRHPWYLAGLLVLWARHLTLADLVVNAVLVFYLWVGTLLEERKLVRAYGEEYRRYQRRVSMLVPWKWIVARLRRSN